MLPAAAVRQICPLVPLAGATTVRPVAVLLLMLASATAVPLKLTLVTPVRLVPTMFTTVPPAPPVGEKLVMAGPLQLKK